MDHDDYRSYWALLMDGDRYVRVVDLYEQQELSLSAYGGSQGWPRLADMKQDV